MERILNLEAVIQHQKNASEQRFTYNFQRKSAEFLRNKILPLKLLKILDVDFKQKIAIGLSPIQANSEYYNLDNRTCLGKQTKYSLIDNLLNILHYFRIWNNLFTE